jgi:hypothetical protein
MFVASIEILIVEGRTDASSATSVEAVQAAGATFSSDPTSESAHYGDCACLCACSCINAQSVVLPRVFEFGDVALASFRVTRVCETITTLPRARPDMRPPLV